VAGPIAARRRCSRLSALVALAVPLAFAGCGGGSHAHTQSHPTRARTAPGPGRQPSVLEPADPRRVAIVRAWVDALRAGNLAKASSYFAVPSIVQNAGPAYQLRSRLAVRLFNASLPCGGRVVRAVRAGRYTIVTFELTERRKSVQGCGSGVGELAATAFAFRHERISEWLRVTIPPSERKKVQAAA
jgi:hypothetical protein